jgi:cell division protein FtsN
MGQARRKPTSSRKSRASNGLGMFMAGVVVGAVTALFINGIRSDDPESLGRGIEHMIASSKNRYQPPVAEDPIDVASAEPESTEYLFYELLPEIEHIVPAAPPAADGQTGQQSAEGPLVAESTASVQQPSMQQATAPAASGPRYELQAGAFVRMSDADRLRANLAMAGLESRIQKVSIEGRGDFFRVRLGPFEDSEQLGTVDGKLASMGIKTLRLRISGS